LAKHVDILKPGTASPLARVTLDDDHQHVSFQADDQGYWRQLLTQLVDVDPDEEPERFARSLHDRVDSTYVYATDLHDDARCPAPGSPLGAHLPAGA
jgi:hypothetical protein